MYKSCIYSLSNSIEGFNTLAFYECPIKHIHTPYGVNIYDYLGKGGLTNNSSDYHVLDANGFCSDPDCPMGLYYEYESDIYDNFTESPTVTGAVDVVLSAKRMDVLDSADIIAYIYIKTVSR